MKALLASLLTMFSFLYTKANINEKSTNKIEKISKRYHKTISFNEKGIEFHIFLNGEFDFNTNPMGRYTNGVRIERDYYGKIRRVGNVFINYDYNGNVQRIGNVFMGYRYGKLCKVGGLYIHYDYWGNPHFEGRVKRSRYYHSYYSNNYNSYHSKVYDYDDDFFYHNNFRNQYQKYKEDKHYYYYKALPNVKEDNSKRYIKRRKRYNKGLYKPNKRHEYIPEQNRKSRRN